MKPALLATALVATVALSSCTAAVAPPAASRSEEASGSVTAEPDGRDEPGGAGSQDGPLRLDDTRGKGCASLRVGREYTAWEHVLEPDTDVTLAGWSLRGAENVAVGRGFVAEVPRRVAATGFTLGFPPGRDAVGSRNVDWEGRRPAAGATLQAGTRSNFWVRVRVLDGVRSAGYRGLTLYYTADGQEFTASSDLRMRFRPRCS